MPTPTSGAPLVEQQEGSSRRKRKRKREDDDDHHHEDDMSPEEEASASPPAAVIAGGREDDDQRRMSSPPSGSKFLHDEVLPITRITEDGVDDCQALTNLRLHKHRDEEEDAASSGCSDDETTSRQHQSGSKVKTKEGSRDVERPRNFAPVVEDSLGTSSDVEKFDGKIVYNPDGSAYIIEDSEMSEEDTGLEVLPRIIGDGCIVDGRGVSLPHLQSFPQIANAFYVSRNPSLYNALYGGTASYSNNLLQDKKIVPEVPIMHSYRVYTVRDSKSGDSEDGKMYDAAGRGDCDGRKPEISEKKVKSDKFSGKDCSSVPVKPILMCFICKLSFGYAKSFVAHAMGDHNVALLEDEKDILGHKNASAIIQCVGKDKEPLVSFLEPLSPGVSTLGNAGKRVVNPVAPPLSEADMNNLMAAAGITSTAVSQLVPKDQQVSYAVGGGGDECAGADKKAVDSIEPESLVVHRRHTLDCGTGSGIAPMGRPNVQNIHVPETSVSLPQNCGSSSNSSNNHTNCNSNSRMIGIGMNSVMDLTRKSPISASAASSGNNGRGSVSPGASPSPGSTLSPLLTGVGPTGPLQYPQPPPNFLTGTTIGVCPDHMGGRPSGVECAKCELILNSSRLGGGGVLAGMHSRNSCKTLKCPKCNWHYKYQETLEIHMKEKHPEAETSCIYCIAGQPHPRLARGETYTCGYKPYRCEVCNYSTTTKGNLSIHMQSDKHLNNMQELQNGGGTMPPTSEPSGISGPPPSTQPPHHGKSPGPGVGMMSPGGASHPQHSHHQMVQSQKPKPTFRCDVCNYETNVARNLRIHMTSEKHTHNMMVLQQNVKHMQTLSALHQQSQQHQQHQHQQQLSFESLLHFHPGLTLPGDKPPPHTEAALADMAYNQALLIQMMTGGQLPPHIPPELAPHMDMGLNPETMEPPPEPADPNPQHLFQCCVCNIFSTDSLEALSHHLSADRTKTREQEILAVVAGHYVCRLCTYKTNLKANFQLHCKTDKHLQRLQHVNHVKEGGPRNEWKLKYVSSSSAAGGIQVRCHACDYYTNSAHKLQLHAAGQRHEASCLLFLHLRDCESSLGGSGGGGDRVYHCALCGFSSRAKLQLLQHVRSMKHLQMEQLHQLQRRSEGKDLHTDIGEVFQVIGQEHAFSDMTDPDPRKDHQQQRQQLSNREQQHHIEKSEQEPEDTIMTNSSNHQHMCPYCNYTSSSEMRIQAHVLTAHGHSEPSPPPPARASSPVKDFLCPLCQDGFRDRAQLEVHVMQIHSVNSEGLQRLLLLVDQSHWLNAVSRSSAPSTPQSQPTPHHPQHHTPPGSNSHPHHNQMISPSSSSAGSSKELDSSGGKQNNSDVNSIEDREDHSHPDLMSPSPDDQSDADENRCQTCFKLFRNIDELCAHQNETGHLEIKQTPSGPGYLCWKKGCNQYFPTAHSLQMHFREIHSSRSSGLTQQGMAVSEKHVYKYRCNQCSLAFKTMEKLQLHSQYHLIRDATKCVLCGRSFRSVIALHKHVETSHAELTDEELAAYKQSLMNNPLLLAGFSGQVLDPSTNELLKKESLKMDSDDLIDTDESPTKDHSHNQDDGMGNSHSGDGENSDDSVVYKEQQFLEDYLNSQAIAEDSYNDPNRKYKCHRCKVAFTRQSYLTSHNKTLLHRKGEKLSYPMEKYLDPNRPYKCDVCKESFTQKNILLVHYNSVSHLHKLKRAMQEQQQQHNNNNNNNGATSVSPVSAAAALAASLGVTPPPTPKSSNILDDDDKKPYKCNICKVAYSQGSTLDIHMRSVLHQTRASKLQDLAISGQIDLSKPLIEQPEPQKIQDQHKKMLQDILGTSPKQTTTSPSSGVNTSSSSVTSQVPSLAQGSPPVTGSHIVPQSSSAAAVSTSTPTMTSVPSSVMPNNATTPNSSTTSHINNAQVPPVIASSPSPQHGMLSCQRCSALFANQEQLTTHQQLYCLFGSPMNIFPPMPTPTQASTQTHPSHCSPQPSGHKTPPPVSTTPHLQDDPFPRVSVANKKPSQVYKHLLESFGFDLVMQFNENHQRRQRKEREEENEAPPPPMPSSLTLQQPETQPEGVVVKIEVEDVPEQDLPEVAKSVCQHCRKEFSSVWVLKAHCEEVHRDLVPPEFLEKYAQQIKSEYEKKGANASGAPSAPGPVIQISTSSNTDAVPEKEPEDNKEALHAKMGLSQPQQHNHHRQATPPVRTPPAPSTPTASSTPASSTDSIPATLSTPMAVSMMGSANNVASGNPQSLSMSLAQQMNEMQAALNVMAASQLQQQLQQFNPMMMGMAGLGMGLPLGLNMNALAAMNLQPPLVPMMMPPPPFDTMSLAQAQSPLFSPQGGGMDHTSLLAKQQQHLLQQQQQAVSAAQQKRARTRITDDQLKILRAHFDINNSPSEDQIHEMAGQSGLPPKVIKHWFRNTLFKERQRNKDSPYNFNNPPSTTLNLEEYEKTGETKVMPLNSSSSSNEDQNPKEFSQRAPAATSTPSSSNKRKQSQPQSLPQPQPFPPEMIKLEPRESIPSHNLDNQEHKFNNLFMDSVHRKDVDIPEDKPQNLRQLPSPLSGMGCLPPSTPTINECNIMSTTTPLNVRTSSPSNLTLTSIIASQLGSDSITTSHPNMGMNLTAVNSSQNTSASNMLPPKLTPPNFTSPNHMPTSPNILPLTPSSRSVSPGRSYNNNSSDGFGHGVLGGGCGTGGNSNGSNSSGGSSGKRANRTRFTDYQIKVLQEFFENNAYPKDDDLEYLSKLLSLSPRVIVVWFQNARQKARKVYENQPPVEAPPGVDETGANRFQRTPGLNYQCKKCLLVFQRYYELIRHQKTHCFKEEDAKRSAQAQAAAAQIAAVLSSEDSNSSTIAEQSQQQPQQQQPQHQHQQSPHHHQQSPHHQQHQQHQQQPPPSSTSQSHQQQQTNMVSVSTASGNPATPPGSVTPTPASSLFPSSPIASTPTSTDNSSKEGTFQCDKCNLVFPRFDLWREHQLVHIMNPNLFPTYPPDSPFGILQQHAQIQQQQHLAGLGVADLSMNSSSTPPHQHPLASMLSSSKRKYEDYEDVMDRDGDQPKDKRLRTTILPEQLDYLYQKYQLESNPSRKMLENIAREVGLKKRVVQVWFQNTRARERKGQFRAHAQVINKRCPFCPALFKVKSALESHLVTKHADQCTRGEINIDALPDEELSMESAPSFSSQMGDSVKVPTSFGSNNPTPNMMPPLFPPFHSADMESSLKKYYEESMKRYLNELQAHHVAQNGGIGKEGIHIPTDLSMKIKQEPSLSEVVGERGGSACGADGPLDLSKPVDLSRPMKVSMDHEMRSMMAEQGPLTDLSERSICYDDDSASETTEIMDGDESNPTSPASSTQSGHQRHSTSGGGSSGGGKRFRTQMSSLQVKAMKSLFSDYKTPTMAECEMLGREIGLPKRVVQVWFQNARAKEKKNKLALQKVLGGPEQPIQEGSRSPEECKLCLFKYSHKYSIQDHIFTKKHIDNVKAHIESGKAAADNSGNTSDGGSVAGEFTVPPVPGLSGVGGDVTVPPPTQSPQFNNNQQQLAQLQMLQMAGLSLPNSLSAQAMAAAASGVKAEKDAGSKSPAPGGVPGPEDMALLHQLYGLGLAGFPGAGNLFLHPAMFSAAVYDSSIELGFLTAAQHQQAQEESAGLCSNAAGRPSPCSTSPRRRCKRSARPRRPAPPELPPCESL